MRFVCKCVICGVCIFILNILVLGSYSYADSDNAGASIRVMNIPGEANVTLTLRNISDNLVSPSGIITWSSVNAGHTRWKIADQYVEITYTDLPPGWGMQIFTDNTNTDGTNPANPEYTGNANPAGLINANYTMANLPLAWRITDSVLDAGSLYNPVERPDGKGFRDYFWRFIKDKQTPDDEDTDENEGFLDGEDYATLWNQKGIAWHENSRTNPQVRNKAYLYLAVDFSTSQVDTRYATNTLSIETFTGAEIFPFFIYKDGQNATDLTYQYIKQQMDQYFKNNEPRLIRSYSHPVDYGYIAGDTIPNSLVAVANDLAGKAFTYDSALSICALLANPTEDNLRRARVLCESLIWARSNVGTTGLLRDAYDAQQQLTTGYDPSPYYYPHFLSSNSGNNAWAIIALMQYYKNAPDADAAFKNEVLNEAVALGALLHIYFNDPSNPGHFYGYNEAGGLDRAKSTENNIAIYVAYSHLYDITRDNNWLNRANRTNTFIDSMKRGSPVNRLLCGVDATGTPNTGVLAADCNLLAVLGINMPLTQKQNFLTYTIDTFRTRYYSSTMYTDDNFMGIDFGFMSGQGPDGVWFEGTAQLASAYQVANDTLNANTYIKSIEYAQGNANYANNIGITSASVPTTTGFGSSYYPFPHIGATAWYISAKRGYNMLWGTELNIPVPMPGDNRSYTPETTEFSTIYFDNHYAPTGWMSGGGPTFVDSVCTDNPASDNTCFRMGLNATWRGLVWQEPTNEWQDPPDPNKGYDLRGATKLKFSARANRDNTTVRIYMGYGDDSSGTIPFYAISFTNPDLDQMLTLNEAWQEFEIDLEAANETGRVLDMSHISNGFTIIAETDTRSGPPVHIYVDNIRYEAD